MKLLNVKNIDGFFEIVNSCEGKVELCSPWGDRLILKSKLTQYVALAKIFSDGEISEMELVLSDKNDIEKFVKFMMEN